MLKNERHPAFNSVAFYSIVGRWNTVLKTIIVLEDGTEICSGAGTNDAVQQAKITERVNSNTELTLGSACANMFEARIIAPGGNLRIEAGTELTVYKIDDNALRHKVGMFTAEKPTRQSANIINITAYDRVSWLDKDLTQWLAGLNGWPYALIDFAVMVCDACGLTLVNDTIPNDGYPVQRFSADGITGRQLMQWIGEIAGRFCRATVDGKIEFAWYTPAEISLGAAQRSAVEISYENGNLNLNVEGAEITEEEGGIVIDSEYLEITDDGQGNATLIVNNAVLTQYYFQNGLSYEDYAVAPIEKVQLRQNEEDVGTVYPDVPEEVNTYIITGNYLLTAGTADDLKPIAQTLYEHLKDVTYTPCKVAMPAGLSIKAGNTVMITDKNGKTITAYVMTRTQSGQKDTLECTGSARRDCSTAVNNQSYKALTGKVLNLRTDVEGIKAENKDTSGRVTKLQMDIAGIRTQVAQQESTADGLQKRLTSVEQSAEGIDLAVKSIQENGVDKVTTETGYSFSDNGLIISRSGEEMKNRMDHTGMYVERSGEVILQANNKGVVAKDVTVLNYLVVGNHARFEDYSDGTDTKRTACFWIGE